MFVLLRQRRLRCFGHVKRNCQEESLGKILELGCTGRFPQGRPKTTWRKTVETDMKLVEAFEIDALGIAIWKKQIRRRTP